MNIKVILIAIILLMSVFTSIIACQKNGNDNSMIVTHFNTLEDSFNNTKLARVQFDNHSWIICTSFTSKGVSTSFIHHPDCTCFKKVEK